MLGGCAKVADPQPPNITPPATINDLRLEQLENHIVLDFSLPLTYEGGAPLPLKNMAIYRLVLPRSSSSLATPEQMEQEGQIIKKLWPDDLQALLKNGRTRFFDVVAFPDPLTIFQRNLVYAVRFYSPRKVASRFSNMAFISPLAPALAPVLRPPRVSENGVTLLWNPPARNMDGSIPARIAGYRVFRGSSDKELEQLADIEGNATEFSDTSVVAEQTYYYAVRTRSAVDPPAFGPVSAVVSAATTDVFAPAAPSGLSASATAGKVELVWEPNSEIDLQGYNVYKSAAPDGPWRKLNSAVLVPNSFPDQEPGAGVFYYRVTAVDRKGNESAPSQPARVEIQ
jgi:hypothetical protein